MPKKQTFPLDRRMWTHADEKDRPILEGGIMFLYTSKGVAVEDVPTGAKVVRVQVQVDIT